MLRDVNNYVFDEENLMSILYLLFGIYLFFISLFSIKKLKNYKAKINKTKEAEVIKVAKVQKNMQEHDLILNFFSKLDASISLKLLIFIALSFILIMLNNFSIIHLKTNSLIAFMLLIFISCLILPDFIVKLIIEKNIRKITNDIPMFIDLLAICIQSGMSIENSIIYLQNNIGKLNPIFKPYLAKVVNKMQVNGLALALDELAQDLPSKEVLMLTQTIKQSLKYGSGVYEQLMSLSKQIKENSLLQTEEIIGQLSAKMSIPLILFFMFPVIIIIAAPGVMRILNTF